jgi:hypothetical protein
MEKDADAPTARLATPRFSFFRHLSRNGAVAVAVVAVSLGGGMLGYHVFEGMGPIDAFVNAAMILSGMGPLTAPLTDAGKIFAGIYALCAGFLLVAIWGLILSPFLHAILNRLHIKPTEM